MTATAAAAVHSNSGSAPTSDDEQCAVQLPQSPLQAACEHPLTQSLSVDDELDQSLRQHHADDESVPRRRQRRQLLIAVLRDSSTSSTSAVLTLRVRVTSPFDH